MTSSPVVLASRSPRRLELLSLLVDRSRIIVRPPVDADEAGFDDCSTIDAVQDRLLEIARGKGESVRREMGSHRPESMAIVAADTTIVAESGGGALTVLGQPPVEDRSRPTLRKWFEDYYFRAPHLAMTAVWIETAEGRAAECISVTTVSFDRSREEWLDWYLSTDEPDGKAGGYAIQGLASVFVDRIEGSLTNVVGLPLAETRELLLRLNLVTR